MMAAVFLCFERGSQHDHVSCRDRAQPQPQRHAKKVQLTLHVLRLTAFSYREDKWCYVDDREAFCSTKDRSVMGIKGRRSFSGI